MDMMELLPFYVALFLQFWSVRTQTSMGVLALYLQLII